GGTLNDGKDTSAPQMFTISVVNVAPTVTPPIDQISNEGSSQAFDLGSFSNPGTNGPWAVDVNWGDNTPAPTFNAPTAGALGSQSHTYADGGTYTVTETVANPQGGTGSAKFHVVVANVPPAVTAPADQTTTENNNQSFSLGSFSDPGPDSPWAV